MDALRVGIVGLGTFGEIHLKAYTDHPATEIAGICDLDRDRLDAAGEAFGVEGRFTDYRELLDTESLDAVSIVTPDFTHTDIVIAAVERGKAVLVEKPLATTREDCERIGSVLQTNPVPFMVDFHNRWNPGVVQLRNAIAAGELGRVSMAYHRLSDTIFVPTEMLSWAGRSSVSWFLGSHCVDTLRWSLGDEVAAVYSVAESRVLKNRGIDTPDYVLSVLEFRGGSRAIVENCWILPESSPTIVDFKLEVVGEKAAFYYDPMPERLMKLGPERAECVDTHGAVPIHGRTVGFCVESVRYFADCVIGGVPPLAGYADGLAATSVVLAMEESVRTGRRIEL
jgi:predicted dehydrogenase